MTKKFLVELTMFRHCKPEYLLELEESDDIEKVKVVKVLDNGGKKMLEMKRNKEFEIKIKAGTNVEMTNEEFLKEICESLGAAELLMNSHSKVRFHMEQLDNDLKIVKKWTPEKTEELVEKLENLGRK